ncbi:MAG: aminotransferase class I/II-fold pyridoxal phosphate-dependent enzyme [Chloroflexota bacterium]|nr:aminotransferase class I/II-fold pyridoxal phosphate-dependent enzyme [Chloroflexota bacterium]
MPRSGHTVSHRAGAIAATESLRLFWAFLQEIDYVGRRGESELLDFTFGDPREMSPAPYVAALHDAIVPRNESWFAYTLYEPEAQAAAAAGLRRLTGLPFAPEDMLLTTGGFAALSLGMKVVAEPGDEVLFSLPPWFCYEPIAIEAGLVPVKVRIDPQTLGLDIEAIAAAITPRTRIVIVNSPNNPTGRIYEPELLMRLAAVLEEASARNGRRIFILSDEPYNRIVFSGERFCTPAEFYAHTLIAYSYGKTLLAPGQRIGYLALPSALPEREALREAVQILQFAVGFAFPNAVMQHALPELETQSIDIARLERRRDMMVDALTAMGYQVHRPQGTFYLFPRSPLPDDAAFARLLAGRNVLVVPGAVFETPGFFRISLTATDEMCQQALPAFAAAIG